jgi:hypothetical protein
MLDMSSEEFSAGQDFFDRIMTISAGAITAIAAFTQLTDRLAWRLAAVTSVVAFVIAILGSLVAKWALLGIAALRKDSDPRLVDIHELGNAIGLIAFFLGMTFLAVFAIGGLT